MSDEEVISLVKAGKVATYALEKVLGGAEGARSFISQIAEEGRLLENDERNVRLERAVKVRRGLLRQSSSCCCFI